MKKTMKILLSVLVLTIVLTGILVLNPKENQQEEKKKLEETYTMYVKINPTVKLTFKTIYYECKNEDGEPYICGDITDEVIDYELVNNDAKEIYYNTDLKGKSILESLVTLCDTAADNKVAFEDFEIITDWENMYNEQEIKAALKENSKYEKEYDIILDFEKVIKEEEIEKEEEKIYIVKFDTDGGNKIDNQLLKGEEKVNKPQTPIKKGYNFVEWQVNGKKYNFDSEVKEDITLKAKWKKIEEQKEENKEEAKEEKINKTIKELNVSVENLGTGYTAKVGSTANVELTVKGDKSLVESITKDNISLYVDLKGLKSGSHNVKVLVKNLNDKLTYTIKPEKISIVITDKNDNTNNNVNKPSEEEPVVDKTQSRIEKINLNENILFYHSGGGYGGGCGTSKYKMFATNLETLFPGAVKNKKVTIITQENIDYYKSEGWDLNTSEYVLDTEWDSKYSQITFDSVRETNLINVFKNLAATKTVGLSTFEYEYNNHQLKSYSYGTIRLEDTDKFITLNKSLEDINNNIQSKINNAVKGMYQVDEFQGGCGSMPEPELLDEETCQRYNLICDRW